MAGPITFERHKKVAEGQQNGAEQHCLALADIAVGQITADNRSNVDQCGIGTIDDRSFTISEQPVLDQIENQQGAHTVVRKTLPHFCHEQQEQPLGVPDHFCLRPRDKHDAANQERRQCDDCYPECPHFECGPECEEDTFDHENPLPLVFESRPSCGQAPSPKTRTLTC